MPTEQEEVLRMSQDNSSVLPCACADNAPQEVRCPEESYQFVRPLPMASKRIDRRRAAFEANRSVANLLRVREAYASCLAANELVLARCRPCIEHIGEMDRIEANIAICAADIEEIDRNLAEAELEATPEQQLRDQRRQQHRRAAAARTGIRVTRRLIRWIARQ